jgi:hypothetical protein
MCKTQPASLQHTEHRSTYQTHNPTSRWIDAEQTGNSYNNQQVRKQNNIILNTTHLHTIYKLNI